jgi:3-hydroxybutyryl-CoA dehydrogenase
MEIVVLAKEGTFDFLQTIGKDNTWNFTDTTDAFFDNKNGDVYFDLRENAGEDYSSITKPVFINNMVVTLAENHHNKNVLRINAWPGFIETDLWEIAGEISSEVDGLLQQLNKKYIAVPDEPGFVSARIIAMIINEAYFAKDEEVSTETDIDIAMKLGTNYPYGPFVWCKKIGVHQVYALLQKLSLRDERFLPSAGLAAANKNI